MSQAPNPFTQAASQGYGEFAGTIDDNDEEHHAVDEEQPDGPESPEPEVEEEEMNEHGFTQTQERSYPTGIESPDEDDEEAGPSSPAADQSNEQVDDEEEEEQPVGPSSPAMEEVDDEEEEQPAGPSSPAMEEEEEQADNAKQRRRVQIMNDSDNEDDEKPAPVHKEKSRHFLKQFTYVYFYEDHELICRLIFD